MPILTGRSEIEDVMRRFVRRLETRCDLVITVKLGYQGGYEDCAIRWSRPLGLWYYSEKIEGSRYWNPLGLSDVAPRRNQMLPIVCEINPPVEGLNKKTQGAVERDKAGRIWLLHRGRIGGGKPGIGRKLFFDNYEGDVRNVEGDTFAVVGDIDSQEFVEDVRTFVREVERIKSLVT